MLEALVTGTCEWFITVGVTLGAFDIAPVRGEEPAANSVSGFGSPMTARAEESPSMPPQSFVCRIKPRSAVLDSVVENIKGL